MKATTSCYPDFLWTFSTLGCPSLNLDSICALAREYGLRFVEIRATEDRVELPQLFKERFGRPESLSEYLLDQQVSISCLNTSLKLVGNDEDCREEFLKFLPWAEAIGTKTLRVFDGGTVPDGLNDEAYQSALTTFEWWSEERSKNQWSTDIAIETHDCLVSHPALERILKAKPDLNIIWDTHHTWKKSGDSVETSWQKVAKNVCNIHIKDSISVPSAKHPFSYVNLGEGEFPLEDTLQLLKQNNYQSFVSIEWEKMWHPYMPDLQVALTKAKEFNWF
ncbi:MAG: sugar phosphate isomerase [Opitutaceae bacterium]|mgnify:CR=1 FL=1|nr:sugar phosphate isomerase [Opitutaceae bacterium]|tara:strand:- start:1355 stop:2188 length:834 start_codon:yes stop_codon:yes gene_type:complete